MHSSIMSRTLLLGAMNGTTSEDRTNYYEVLPSDRLGLGLWLESDRMLSLAITQENFDNQREVVKEERRTSYDNQAYNNGWLAFDALAYTCWPYHHSTIGPRPPTRPRRVAPSGSRGSRACGSRASARAGATCWSGCSAWTASRAPAAAARSRCAAWS